MVRPVVDLFCVERSSWSAQPAQIKVAPTEWNHHLTAPLWLYQLWAFIAPALHRKERRTSVYLSFYICSAISFQLLFLDTQFLPVAVKVLFGRPPARLLGEIVIDYLDSGSAGYHPLVFGIACFELPVSLVAFNLIGSTGRAIS
jgi:sec-independent protein translocase protein TatC